MTSRIARPLLALVALAWGPLHAQDSVLLQAMRDELQRSVEELQLGGMEKPYFVAYRVHETKTARATASLGAVASRIENAGRLLTVEVRVGDPAFDNTNFHERPDFRSPLATASAPKPLPLEDDYAELRRNLWLATDGAYKQALDHLSKKRAALQNATRVDDAPDFSAEDPHQFTDDREPVDPDPSRVASLARELSAVFRGMPHVFVSEVRVEEESERILYVNSEGSTLVRMVPGVSIRVLAGTQSDDGAAIEDAVDVRARYWEDLPERSALLARARELADQLERLRAAEYLDRYTGPILFEGPAAATLVRQVLVPRLLAEKAPVSGDSRFARFAQQSANPFLDKLGSRVLPRSLSVVDDPTLAIHDGVPLLGGYAVDDEAVPARETTLVQRGILKTLLSTRNPAPGVPASTGSRRYAGASPSNLVLVPHAGLDPDALRAELLSLVEERDLEFGIRIRRIGNPQGRLSRGRRSTGSGERSQIGGVVAYKVFPDGREELIRQAVLQGVSESSFRDIVATSSATVVHHAPFTGGNSLIALSGFRRPAVVSVVAPSLLFEDVTLRRPPGTIPDPPLVPHPLAQR